MAVAFLLETSFLSEFENRQMNNLLQPVKSFEGPLGPAAESHIAEESRKVVIHSVRICKPTHFVIHVMGAWNAQPSFPRIGQHPTGARE